MKFKLTVFALGFIPALVIAVSAPNLVGTWKGQTNTVVMGVSGHDEAPSDGNAKRILYRRIPVTLTVSEQKGDLFVGSKATAKRSEPLVGAISSDGKTGVMSDEDSTYTFKLINKNKLEYCISHANKDSSIAGCTIFLRQ